MAYDEVLLINFVFISRVSELHLLSFIFAFQFSRKRIQL